MVDKLTDTQALVYQMYKDEKGEPILLSPGQDFIFRNISKKLTPRIHIMCHTRYGKSMAVALATLTRLVTYPEKWAIIAGEKDKAAIIMNYVISHIFDNEFTASRFVPDKGETVDEIRRHKSKSHLTFVINPQEKDPQKRLLSELSIGTAKAALGHGAKNIIEDESAIIPDRDHYLVMRMLGDDPHENFLVKIGNPFTRGHFLQSFRDPLYRKIVIDCYRSLQEGRMSQETIDENRAGADFSVLFECKFPRENEIDETGYMQLLLQGDIDIAQKRVVEPTGKPKLGVDVARGGRNFNVYVLRGTNYARVLLRDSEESSVRIADQTAKFMREYGVEARDTFIDDTGVGHGVVSVLREKGLRVVAVNFGEKAIKYDKYINTRAESYAGDNGVAIWIKQGAYLEPNIGWNELLRIKYRKQPNNGRTQIESKDDMRKRGVESPDCFIAGTLITTPQGYKSIETMQEGDSVITPMGISRVIKLWETDTSNITSVRFSNGARLQGKGKHEVFTWDKGWCRLDELSLVNEIETDNKFSLFLWQFLQKYSIRTNPFTFKHQVGIISQAGRIHRNDFYTAGYGKIISDRFQMGMKYTIGIITGRITNLLTLSYFQLKNIITIIWQRTWKTRYIENMQYLHFGNLATLPPYGINQMQGDNGIASMQKTHGTIGSYKNLCVLIVVKSIKRTLHHVQDSVLMPVWKINHIDGIRRLRLYVSSAIRNLHTISFVRKPVVPVLVQTNYEPEKRKVYNLTLDTENAYYANGILVANCADALALTFAKVKNPVYTGNINPSAVLGNRNEQPYRPWGGVEKFIEGVG